MTVQEELDLWAVEPTPALLTIKQAAQILNLSRSTIYQLIAEGELEVVHVGRAARIPVDSISALIARLRAGQDVGARS